MAIAILLAAGSHRRTGKINKLFYKIKGKPLIFYTISAFEKSREIEKIILVTKKSVLKKLSCMVEKYKFKKVPIIIEGGKTRQESSFKAQETAENFLGAKANDIILFHNGCNPLVSKKEIQQVIMAAKKHGAAIVAQKAKDTIKKADKNKFILETIPRENIYLAQTPQAIKFDIVKRAFKKAKKENFNGTDDASLVERLGIKIKIIEAGWKNIKVTVPEDFKFIKSQIMKA